jgi:hypothetical protein
MDFLSTNSRFAVQNGGPYLRGITRETCILFTSDQTKVIKISYVLVSSQQPQSFASSCFQGARVNLQQKHKSIWGMPMASDALHHVTFGSLELAKCMPDLLVQRPSSDGKKVN